MKKTIIAVLFVVIALTPAVLFAQDAPDTINWESFYHPGSLNASAGVGWPVWGFGVQGGAEFFLAQIKIADTIPLDFGVAGRAGISFSGPYSGMALAFGGYGTAHLTFGGLDLPFDYLDNLDLYFGLGIGIGLGEAGGIGLSTIEGANYYITKTLALYAETIYYGGGSDIYHYNWGYTFGVTIKL